MQTKKANKPKPSIAAISFGKRLRTVMGEKNIQQVDIIRQTKTNKSTVSQWYNGLIKAGQKNSKKLADYIGCDREWLATGEGEPFSGQKTKTLLTGAFEALKHKTTPDSGKVTTPTYIPVVGRVPAGIPETNEWEIEYSIQVPDMPAHCFAMKVIGDSMEPRIMDGEHVIFTLDYTLESGNVVIVTDEYGDSMVKRYKVKDGVQYLVSDNSKYPPVKPNGGFNIVGKVISSVLLKKH